MRRWARRHRARASWDSRLFTVRRAQRRAGVSLAVEGAHVRHARLTSRLPRARQRDLDIAAAVLLVQELGAPGEDRLEPIEDRRPLELLTHGAHAYASLVERHLDR